MTLGQKQELFAGLMAKLIIRAIAEGYKVRVGEVYRTKYQAREYARLGIGIINSAHCNKLAVDMFIFMAGKDWQDTETYRELGEWWEEQHPLCKWGGHFRNRDGRHFSLEHNGVR